jgi:hypothetical protein
VSSDGLVDAVDGELTDTARRILSGLTGQDYECQMPTPCEPTLSVPWDVPWDGDRRAAEKTAIFGYVHRRPEGASLSQIAHETFIGEPVENAGAGYQLARRFVEDCKYLETARKDGRLYVEPAPEAFCELNLSPQYANRKTTRGRGDGLPDGSNPHLTASQSTTGDCQPVDDGGQYPRDRAQSILDKRVRLDGRNGQDYRAGLLRQLGTEREIQQDKFKILRRVRGSGPEHLLIPYLTRFNDADRAGDIQQGFRTALQRASQRHQDAVVVTLTSDAKRFSSVSEAVDGLTEAKGRFMSWLSTDYQLGKRPDNLSVLEWTAGGLPHVHLVLFGIDWLLPQSTISAKWDSLGQGSVVDIRSAEAERGGQRWFLHNDDGSRVTLRQYLGKAIRGLQRVAESDAGDLVDAVEDGDIELWRQALYWATGRQYCSCSPSLKDSGDSDGLPHVKRYEFVGVAQYHEIPAHVKRDAAILDRPPPASRQSTASTESGQSTSTTASAAGD